MKVRALNLDGMFIPVPAPEIEFDLFKFSGGELNIKLNSYINYSDVDKVVITHRVKNMDDLMAILIAKNALEIKGISEFDLIMPYIPYARQDRQCFDGESFTLKVFTSLLNTANFNTVYCLDAHSNVAPALINNCVNLSSERYVLAGLLDILVTEAMSSILLVSPDSGANHKSNDLFKSGRFEGLVKCDKKRDSSGNLSGFEVFASNLNGMPCFISDDICDGGGTFLGLAKELKKKNAGNLYLFVTHGIFSKGLEELSGEFKRIYTTNSFSDLDNVKQFKIYL